MAKMKRLCAQSRKIFLTHIYDQSFIHQPCDDGVLEFNGVLNLQTFRTFWNRFFVSEKYVVTNGKPLAEASTCLQRT